MTPTKDQIKAWLQIQLEKAEHALKARQESVKVWSTGSDKSWRAVGSKLSKSERLEVAARERRISVKVQQDVDMFKATIAMLEGEKEQ